MKTKEIEQLYKNNMFRMEMDINIKQILINRNKECYLMLDLDNNTCFTDGDTINIGVMEEFKGLRSFEIFGLIKALVGHEASHVRYSNFEELIKFQEKVNSLRFNEDIALTIANILEDGRIERLLCEDLRGYTNYIRYLNLKFIYKDGCIEGGTAVSRIIYVILFLSKMGIYPSNFKEIFNKEEQEFIKEMVEPIVFKSIQEKSHRDLLDNTLELLKILCNMFNEIKNEKINNNSLKNVINANKNPKYNTSDEIIDKKIKPLREAVIECESNTSPSHFDNLEINLEYCDIQNRIISDYEGVMKNNKDILNRVSDNKKDCYFDNVDLDFVNNMYNKEALKESLFEYEVADNEFIQYPKELIFDIKILERNFKKILKNDTLEMKNQKKGKLNSSKLWRLSTTYENNVFMKNSLQEKSDYAVYILIDLSASMDSTLKYKEAIATAIKIEGALMNLPNVSIKTAGFNYVNNSTHLTIFKDFKESRSRTSSALYKNYTNGSNRDGFAIRVALKDLEKQHAKNNLLVVISDGKPSWNGESVKESMYDVKMAVHEGRRRNTIMGVLINEGEILEDTRRSFYYMYEDKGAITINVKNKPKDLTNIIALYVRKLLKNK